MPISIPYTNVAGAHETLQQEAPDLFAALQALLEVARGEGMPAARLQRVVEASAGAWGRYVEAGGNPRVAEWAWVCAVADLAEALVDDAIPTLDAAAEPDRKAELEAMKVIVDTTFAGAPNHLSMQMSLGGAGGSELLF